jgi:hypothetical protein
MRLVSFVRIKLEESFPYTGMCIPCHLWRDSLSCMRRWRYIRTHRLGKSLFVLDQSFWKGPYLHVLLQEAVRVSV